jgi:hypothetical protein
MVTGQVLRGISNMEPGKTLDSGLAMSFKSYILNFVPEQLRLRYEAIIDQAAMDKFYPKFLIKNKYVSGMNASKAMFT